MDLVSVIITLWEFSPFTPELQHVYDHLEDKVPSFAQTPIHQLNNRMDKRAKEICLHHINTPGHHPSSFPHSYGIGTITCHQ